MRCCLLLLSGLALAGESATWVPHEHAGTAIRHLDGFTRPGRILTLAAPCQAWVKSVAVEVGKPLAADAVVLRLDDTAAGLALRVARAGRDQAAVAVERARVTIERAQAEAAFRGRESERLERLTAFAVALALQHRQEKERPPNENRRDDDGRGDHHPIVSDTEREAAKQAKVLADVAMKEAALELRSAEAGLALAEATMAQAEDLVRRHVVGLAKGWTVTRRLVEPGSLALVGTPLMECVDCSVLHLDLTLTEDEITVLQAQTEPRGILRNHAGLAVPLQVVAVSPVADPTTGKRTATLALSAADLAAAGPGAPAATGGIAVRLALEIPTRQPVLVVPPGFGREHDRQTVVRDTEGKDYILQIIATDDAGRLLVAPACLPRGVVLVRL